MRFGWEQEIVLEIESEKSNYLTYFFQTFDNLAVCKNRGKGSFSLLFHSSRAGEVKELISFIGKNYFQIKIIENKKYV